MMRMKANLLQDTVEELWVEGKNLGGQVRRVPCSQILCRERETIRCEEGQEAFLDAARFPEEEKALQNHYLPAPYLLLTRSLSAPFVRLRYGKEKERTKYAPCTYRDKGGG